jgi:hypothetical protein
MHVHRSFVSRQKAGRARLKKYFFPRFEAGSATFHTPLQGVVGVSKDEFLVQNMASSGFRLILISYYLNSYFTSALFGVFGLDM